MSLEASVKASCLRWLTAAAFGSGARERGTLKSMDTEGVRIKKRSTR